MRFSFGALALLVLVGLSCGCADRAPAREEHGLRCELRSLSYATQIAPSATAGIRYVVAVTNTAAEPRGICRLPGLSVSVTGMKNAEFVRGIARSLGGRGRPTGRPDHILAPGEQHDIAGELSWDAIDADAYAITFTYRTPVFAPHQLGYAVFRLQTRIETAASVEPNR